MYFVRMRCASCKSMRSMLFNNDGWFIVQTESVAIPGAYERDRQFLHITDGDGNDLDPSEFVLKLVRRDTVEFKDKE